MLDPRDRTALIELVARQAPSPAVRRACLEGEVEVLGGFLTKTSECWRLRIVAKHGTEYPVAVYPIFQDKYLVLQSEGLAWKYWVGRTDRGEYSIYDGDHPARYDALRYSAQQQVKHVSV
jgi:hypothetical protein